MLVAGFKVTPTWRAIRFKWPYRKKKVWLIGVKLTSGARGSLAITIGDQQQTLAVCQCAGYRVGAAEMFVPCPILLRRDQWPLRARASVPVTVQVIIWTTSPPNTSILGAVIAPRRVL